MPWKDKRSWLRPGVCNHSCIQARRIHMLIFDCTIQPDTLFMNRKQINDVNENKLIKVKKM